MVIQAHLLSILSCLVLVLSLKWADPQFDVLLPGDTLTHMAVRALHTDLENFPYQIIYFNAAGPDFVKDTQYTSSRNHVVTARVGFGIKFSSDRAFYGGYFEFFVESVQYTTHNVDLNGAEMYGKRSSNPILT